MTRTALARVFDTREVVAGRCTGCDTALDSDVTRRPHAGRESARVDVVAVAEVSIALALEIKRNARVTADIRPIATRLDSRRQRRCGSRAAAHRTRVFVGVDVQPGRATARLRRVAIAGHVAPAHCRSAAVREFVTAI